MRDLSGYGGREWVTRDGTPMKWAEMTVSHLRNCARMIERNLTDEISAAYQVYGSVQGEAAEDAMESAIANLADDENEARELVEEMLAYADWREARHA